MSLPIELQRLLPQALDVIRYLATREEAVSVDEMVIGTGLSERVLGKAIRRLVTRYYAEMSAQGFYRLTAKGRQAAQDLHEFDGDTLALPVETESELDEAPAPAAPVQAAAPAALVQAPPPAAPVQTAALAAPVQAPAPPVERQERRLSVFTAKEMVIRTTITLRAGFDMPGVGQPALHQPARVIVRLSAPDCDIEPAERPVEIVSNASVGPLLFRVTPHLEGAIRLKLEAFQLVPPRELLPVGGMFFDLKVAGFPTPLSAEFQTLGAMVQLYCGASE